MEILKPYHKKSYPNPLLYSEGPRKLISLKTSNREESQLNPIQFYSKTKENKKNNNF